VKAHAYRIQARNHQQEGDVGLPRPRRGEHVGIGRDHQVLPRRVAGAASDFFPGPLGAFGMRIGEHAVTPSAAILSATAPTYRPISSPSMDIDTLVSEAAPRNALDH
jgi:hypothetical protein